MYDIFDLMKLPSMDLFSKTLKSSKLFSASTRGVLYNKYVLYFVFFVALFQLLYSAVQQDYLYCILFVLVGFLIHFFNKNMTIILTLSIAISTIISNILKGRQLKIEEGLTTEKEEDEKSTKDTTSPATTTVPVKKTPRLEDTTAKITATTSPSALMDVLQKKAADLQDAQNLIINGFEKIEPHMDRAESLISSIQETANQIQGMQNMHNK